MKVELLQNSPKRDLHEDDSIGGSDEEDEHDASNQEEIEGQESPLSRANIIESEALEENEETEEFKIENVRGCSEDLETETSAPDLPGFAGSIQNIFYCDLCDIAFISEEFVTEHIRKYHKILKKDLKQFVSDHCLWKYELK